ncbi:MULTISPECIES: S9 family peptidase [Alteromonadaceae]|uniref:S9 family peptidase n=1 Tax=Brumicola blandensis TaxID=3075611 RepID=A0AAW8QYN6_9ALTE|nr:MULTISPECIES: S9 family peptidase [unclassified Alteromonas]MDT0582273.1 S9 family peptidase [Alteromonas sp. W409]MDT0627771.1 S9 family peptidase [Alteromonas sp. W364]
MKRLFFIFALLCTSQVFATISATDISKYYTYTNADLSPDGSKLAINITQDGLGRLVIMDLSTFKPVGTVSFDGRYEPGNYWWVNNERLVIQVLEREIASEQHVNYGELYSVNYDGSNGLMIFGYRAGGTKTGSRLNRKQSTRGWGELLDVLPDDEKHVLIMSTPMSSDGSKLPTVHKLNVYNGQMSNTIAQSPVPQAEFITDSDGKVKLVVGAGENGYAAVFKRIQETNDWQQLSNEVLGKSFNPIALDSKNTSLYVTDSGGKDKTGLYKFDLETEEVKHLFTDKVVDITSIVFSADGGTPYALRLDDGRPDYVMFGKNTYEVKLYKQFLQTFPGNKVELISRSENGNKWILYVSSDISPGTFYLFDKATNSLQFLFRNLDSIPIELMSESKPVTFAASDDVLIHGFLTLPVSVPKDKDAPLVVLVHGGPHGVRDYWTFDRDVQYLASQGYAVLRVNYRGSGGYGSDYRYSGYQEWGNRIQLDIIEGAQWAMNQDRVSNDRVCIMGASFGGYSAVMAATMAPELFDCVVANAGVYDLTLMFEEGDIPDMLYGKTRLLEYLGDDPDILKTFSPINYISRIAAPILIGHGKKDRRTPFIHAELLRDKLIEQGKPFEWFVKGTESHGFYDEENRAEWYETVAAFLKENL